MSICSWSTHESCGGMTGRRKARMMRRMPAWSTRRSIARSMGKHLARLTCQHSGLPIGRSCWFWYFKEDVHCITYPVATW